MRKCISVYIFLFLEGSVDEFAIEIGQTIVIESTYAYTFQTPPHTITTQINFLVCRFRLSSFYPNVVIYLNRTFAI